MSTTLRKCLRVLESLARSDGSRGISELAREIDLNKSAVQRIFQTLMEEGYIEKVADNNRYRPTLKIWELGSAIITQNEIRRLIRPILRYASKISELTVYLAWADYPDIVYIDKCEGEKGRSNSSDPGQRIPMHLTASGRAILAFLDKEMIAGLTEKAELSGDEVAGEISGADLAAELAATRDRLYAITERGSMSRVSSIAAPIWNGGEFPVGSIVFTSDSTTLPPSDYDRIGAIALNVAEQATVVLGGSFPTKTFEAP